MRESASQPGYFYYYNSRSGQSQWEKPTTTTAAAAATNTTTTSTSNSKIRASHLLVRCERVACCCSLTLAALQVKHAGSRNPSSWREAKITRSKEDALALLEQYRAMLMDGTSFQSLCQRYSDCSSAKNGGDLGFFGRGEMQRPFEGFFVFSLEEGCLFSSPLLWRFRGPHPLQHLGLRVSCHEGYNNCEA